MSKHLTSDQLDALIAGHASADAEAHACECSQCTAEADDLRNLFGSLRQSSTLAAGKQWHIAARDAHTASRSISAPRRAWALALAAAAIVSVVTPAELHRRSVASAEHARAQAAAQVAQRQKDELADEVLLSKVQNDLSISVPRPLQPLTVTTTSTDETTSSERTN